MSEQKREVTIECAGVRSAEELWERYVDAARPAESEHFGRNLDAFWDAIEGEGPGWPGEVTLVFMHSDELGPLRTQSGSSFLDALWKIAADATRIEVQLR